MIGYDEAIARLRPHAALLPMDTVRAAGALGRILAVSVESPESLPPFNNSAMDGFALRCSGSTMRAGTTLDVTGARAAGDAVATAGEGAWEIMTGAPIPAGLDSVVPIEQVEVLDVDATGRPRRIRLLADVPTSQHVRHAGEDVARGHVVAPAGTHVDPALHMLMAAVGVAHVAVRRRPRVAIINTGRELVDDATQPLQGGEIRNSNGPFLASRLAHAGADVVRRMTLGDEESAFVDAVDAAQRDGVDMVLSTGAVSMGRYDFIPCALAKLGASVHFHKVAIRPGKPIIAATLPSGTLFFGLPGNPASTAVGLRFFVEPMLRAMLGMPVERVQRLRLASPLSKRVPLRLHLKASVMLDAGDVFVHALGGQESFRIAPLLQANAWIVVPEAAVALAAGDMVDVYSRGHLQSLEIA